MPGFRTNSNLSATFFFAQTMRKINTLLAYCVTLYCTHIGECQHFSVITSSRSTQKKTCTCVDYFFLTSQRQKSTSQKTNLNILFPSRVLLIVVVHYTLCNAYKRFSTNRSRMTTKTYTLSDRKFLAEINGCNATTKHGRK